MAKQWKEEIKMASDIIKPKILKGFRDNLPSLEAVRKKTITILEKSFTRYGFLPIDTPVLEYTEVLLGKGGGETDKQVYRFLDHGERDVSMRFDLTVPFARYMAQHRTELYLPFKRYHIGKVWRGENTQRGRFREFMQCDFDIVGVDSISSDFEILLLMKTALEDLGLHKFTIHLSNREFFNSFLQHLALGDCGVEILRTIDKVAKIGEEKVTELLGATVSKDAADTIMAFIRMEEDWATTLHKCEELAGGPSEQSNYIRTLFSYIEELGMSEFYTFNPSITRGLDYYTGVVFETFLTDYYEIGSVCSGGRYNNLASLYTKEELPGVGASIGLDRLLAALEHLNIEIQTEGTVTVLILCLDENLVPHYHKLAETLRNEEISCEVYPTKRKLAQQFQFAEKKGIPYALICGEDEYEAQKINIKELTTRISYDSITLSEAITILKARN